MSGGPGYRKDPDHQVLLEPAGGRWLARRGSQVLAESGRVLQIREDGYPPVVYFPADDVRQDRLEPSDRQSYCPFKGEASYRAIDGVDVAWCYETPYDEVEAIAGHLAFYADKVDVERVDR